MQQEQYIYIDEYGSNIHYKNLVLKHCDNL